MKHIGINAKVASHVSSLLASVEGTTVCLEIPLQSPPRETVTWRPSPPPHPGDRRALTREFARGAGGRIPNKLFCLSRKNPLVHAWRPLLLLQHWKVVPR